MGAVDVGTAEPAAAEEETTEEAAAAEEAGAEAAGALKTGAALDAGAATEEAEAEGAPDTGSGSVGVSEHTCLGTMRPDASKTRPGESKLMMVEDFIMNGSFLTEEGVYETSVEKNRCIGWNEDGKSGCHGHDILDLL